MTMICKRPLAAAASLLMAMLPISAARAAVITRTFDFTATGFQSVVPLPLPPISTVTGTAAISFDNQADIANQTNGITLTSLSINLGSPISYTYFQSSDFLIIGGLANGSTSIVSNNNDFFIGIRDVSSSLPTYATFAYSAVGFSNNFTTVDVRGSIGLGAVPEPASWALMIAGFGLVGTTIRRRKAKRLGANLQAPPIPQGAN
jgi:PEP-CTERM motif